MDAFLNAQSPYSGSSAAADNQHNAQRASGFFSNLFRAGKKLEIETENETEMSAFVLPEPVPTPVSPTSPSAAAKPDLFVPVTTVSDADPEPAEVEIAAAGPASVVDVPMPSVSAAANAWQRLAKMTIGRKAKPIIPYYARATTEAAKPVARPAGRVNMLAVPKTPTSPTAPGPAAESEP